jgi:uncharacterized damage-inducible protein DinB
MVELFVSYLDRLQKLHEHILQAIEGLPADALDWSPGAEMNSISVLIVHLTGAERYWIGDVVAGEPSGRVREQEFLVKGWSAGDLKERLNGTLAYARTNLERLSLQDLEGQRVSSRDGESFSGSWALLHALEHTAIHVGQIQVTRQLWEQQQ